MKKNKGQAAVEFAITLPFFAVILAGLMQLSVLMIHRVELVFVERAVMRYMTAEGEERDGDRVKSFAREIAGKSGLKGDAVECKISAAGVDVPSSADPFGLLSGIAGAKIELTYKEKLFPAFAGISGKQDIEFKTTIYSGSGPALQFKIKEKAGEIWDSLSQKH